MALPQGIDFRQSNAYVTDPANYDYDTEARAAAYPWTTAQGNNVGFEIGSTLDLVYRDRSAVIDARLAGLARSDTVSPLTFRIDLPATGNYTISGAFGDAGFGAPTGWDLYDTASSLGTLASGADTPAGSFRDPTNVNRTAAAWPGSQATVTKTFATTIMRIKSTAVSIPVANISVAVAVSSNVPPGGMMTLGAGR